MHHSVYHDFTGFEYAVLRVFIVLRIYLYNLFGARVYHLIC